MPELQSDQSPPPDYYASNLRQLLQHVVEFHGDLMRPADLDYAHCLLALSVDALRLFARLISRKGPWIRQDKLNYAEVGELTETIAELRQREVVRCNDPAPADSLLRLLTTAERRQLFPLIAPARRDDWIADCVSRYPDAHINRVVAHEYPWLSLQRIDRFAACQLLFFGDEHQDTSAFVLLDLGLTRYPAYPLHPSDRMFTCSTELEKYRRLLQLRMLSQRLTETPGLAIWLSDALWLEPLSRHERRLRDRVLNSLGKYFERCGDFDEALSCYARSHSHPARERRVRILTKLHDVPGGARIVERMQHSPVAAEEEDFVVRFEKSPGEPIDTTVLSLAGAQPENIEAHAGQLLSRAGGEAWHLENQLPAMLAGLAYWEVIFMPLRGSFVHPFQSGPLDLFWPDFAANRQAQLDRQDQLLAAGGCFKTRLLASYERYQGMANRLVNWRDWSPERLQLLLTHVPESHLHAIARHLIRQPYRARNGFPDLLVIYGNGSYEFVEVKGPTDSLQPAQRIWLRTLTQLGAPARVLKFKP